ncbi:MAG TPA: cysteine-rich CWC family protein [Burkholderiaceae bacterium]|nr:cysteine-rich CWC family protein [Burkholderiaceae bacterium]
MYQFQRANGLAEAGDAATDDSRRCQPGVREQMSACAHCSAAFSCAMQDGTDNVPCWCTELPPLNLEQMPACAGDGNPACLCPACLQRWILEHATPFTTIRP